MIALDAVRLDGSSYFAPGSATAAGFLALPFTTIAQDQAVTVRALEP